MTHYMEFPNFHKLTGFSIHHCTMHFVTKNRHDALYGVSKTHISKNCEIHGEHNLFQMTRNGHYLLTWELIYKFSSWLLNLTNGRKLLHGAERKVLRIWLKFLLNRRRIRQAVGEILSGHYAQVHIHQGRPFERRLHQHLFKFDSRRRARRPTHRNLSICKESAGQPSCGNL